MTIWFTHPEGVGADPAFPHLTMRAIRKNLTLHPASTALWDIWNDKKIQNPNKPRINRKTGKAEPLTPVERYRLRFGASRVAWRVTNYFRFLRDEGQTPATIEQWWGALENRLTDKDWAELRIQAARLWSRTPLEVREHTGLSKDDCYNFVLLKVVDETFTGLGREPLGMRHLSMLYPEVIWVATSNHLDAGSGFDLAGFTNGRWTHVASVKPITWRYFAADSGRKMWVNRHKEHVKHELFLSRHPELIAIEISGDGETQDWQVVPVLGRACRLCELQPEA